MLEQLDCIILFEKFPISEISSNIIFVPVNVVQVTHFKCVLHILLPFMITSMWCVYMYITLYILQKINKVRISTWNFLIWILCQYGFIVGKQIISLIISVILILKYFRSWCQRNFLTHISHFHLCLLQWIMVSLTTENLLITF